MPCLDADNLAYPTHLRAEIDEYLERLRFSHDPLTAGLEEAMRYTLLAGGKRVRPVLVLAAARAVGMRESAVLPLAAAVELIHTLSLIHDDLPAMDDDDERRGRLANHRVHGEGVAILAADAMFAEAFHLMLTQLRAPAERVRRATALLAGALGANGMAGGQYLDLAGSGDTCVVVHRSRLKTGSLIEASVGGVLELAPAADPAVVAALETYARELGLMFQIVDDMLDAGSDPRPTLASAGRRADECLARIERCLSAAPCDGTELLAIAAFVRERRA